jgi:hypothetical protein
LIHSESRFETLPVTNFKLTRFNFVVEDDVMWPLNFFACSRLSKNVSYQMINNSPVYCSGA